MTLSTNAVALSLIVSMVEGFWLVVVVVVVLWVVIGLVMLEKK